VTSVNDKIRIGRVIAYGGAFISFLIGSGFATGQELMQYFVAYGWEFLLVTLLMFVLFLYVGISFITVGFEQQYEKSNEIYDYYCGPYVGKFYKFFSSIFVYMSFWVMIGGAGATLNQQCGLPVAAGGVLLGVVAVAMVVFGLNRIVDVIGVLGPLIVMLAIFLGTVGIFINPAGIAKAPEMLLKLNLLKAADNWFFSALSYVGFCMLWLAAFMAGMGKTAISKKEAACGAFMGAFFYSLACIVISLGLMANLETIGTNKVPMLTIANSIHPVLGIISLIVVILGIFTTAGPLLWTACTYFVQEGTLKYKLLTSFLGAVGIVVGIYVPFDRLINIVYVINGYVGILLILFMFVKSMRIRIGKSASTAAK
jgi:uncharacterized membrane protein YkvI